MSISERLLALNNYLPSSLQTNNENDIIELLNVILSTQLLVSKIVNEDIDSQVEISINALPNDIQSELLVNMHPYYASSLCNINKFQLDKCENNKYKVFKKWCYPNMTINELKSVLPNLTFGNVVEIALLFHPIPESLSYWDRETLYYHACLNEQPDADDYIRPIIDNKDHQLSTISALWIAYKFNRIDILRTTIRRNSFANGVYALLEYKLYGNTNTAFEKPGRYHHREEDETEEEAMNRYKVDIFVDMIRQLRWDICRLTDTLFTSEEVVELITIFHKVFPFDNNLYDSMISGPRFDMQYKKKLSNLQLGEIFVMYAVKLCDFDKADEILAKYGMTERINRSKHYENFTISSDILNPIAHKQLDRMNTSSIEEVPVDQRWIRHLTSGRMIEYLATKPDRISLPTNKAQLYGLSYTGNSIFNKLIEPNAFIDNNEWNYKVFGIYISITHMLDE